MVSFILFIQSLLINHSIFYQDIRNKALDFLYLLQNSIFPVPADTKDIVIAKIDDETIEDIKIRWPWTRKYFAEILQKLNSFNPKVILFDFMLFGESKEKEDDFLLSAVIKDIDNIILASYYNPSGELVMPLELFSSFAKKTGYINKIKDTDGKVRRFYPFHVNEFGRKDNYCIEICTLNHIYNLNEEDICKDIPLKTDDSAYINYLVSTKDFEAFSLKQIFEDNIDTERLKNKILILGGTSEIMHDAYATPFGNMPGVYIIANTIITLISGRYLIPANQSLLYLILFAITSLSVCITFRYGPGKGILNTILLSFTIFTISFFIFYKGIIFDWFSLAVATLIGVISASFYRYITILKENIKDLEEANIKIKDAQAEIIRREQLSAIGKLTSIIIHELNNPLASISDFIEILKKKIKATSEIQNILDSAYQEIRRAIRIGENLKTSYTPHIEDKTFENINNILTEIIESSVQSIKNKGINLRLNLDNNLPLIPVSKDKIKQVFLNILLNAVDATETGRHIYITTRLFKDEAKAEWVDIIFKDEGCGIPEDEMQNIFNAFHTTKKHAKGTGLGLFISYEIIKAHRGNIFAESKISEGSIFTVRLPIKEQ